MADGPEGFRGQFKPTKEDIDEAIEGKSFRVGQEGAPGEKSAKEALLERVIAKSRKKQEGGGS